MDINNVASYLTLDPSQLMRAQRFVEQGLNMYDRDDELTESYLKEHLAGKTLEYAMHLLDETTTSYMGVQIHNQGGKFSAPTAGVYGASSRPELKAKIKEKVLKKNERENKAAKLRKEELEHLDEISQRTATRAFAKRSTDEYETDGDNPKDFTKSGKSKADQTKSRIVKKYGSKAGDHAERAAHAGIFGRKSSSMPKKPTNEELELQEKKMSKAAHKKAAKAGKRWQDSDGDGKWYEPGEDVKKEEYVDEAMVSGARRDAMMSKAQSPRTTTRDKANIHNIAVRNDTGPSYEKKSTGGKGARYAGYGDQGAGNKARRRSGQEPIRGNTRKEEFDLTEIEDILEIFVEEFIDEGYHEDDVFEAFEDALTEATVTYGHDTEKPYEKNTSTRRLVKAVGRLARKTLKRKGSELKQKATAKYQEKKSGLKKRIGGLAQRVVDRMKEEFELDEVAPPGDKYERMVKHIKKGYSKGGLTDKERSIAYATAWKAKKNEETECLKCGQDLCECDLIEQFYLLKDYLFENEIAETEEDVLDVFENITDDELDYCLEQALIQVKGKRKGNVVINPEVKKVNESDEQKSMQLQKRQLMLNKQKVALQQKATSSKKPVDMHVEENLHEVDTTTRAVEFGAEIEKTNVRRKKEKKALSDFRKLSMGGRTKTEDVEIEEGMKQARKNVGASSCWDGYEAKGTKKKGGKEVPNCEKEEVELDERTRYAKETGKDPQTGKPSVKGGDRPPSAMKSLQKSMRDTGGMMSSRRKPIQPQGKKKVPGAKGYQGVTPVDKIRGKLARKRAPKPDIGSRFD